MSTIDTQRKANLPTLMSALKDQLTRAVDVVAPATKIRAHNGSVVVDGVAPITVEPKLTADGVTPGHTINPNGVYRCTQVADEGISAKLDVPRRFLADTRADAWNPVEDYGDLPHGSFGGGKSLFDHIVNARLTNAARRNGGKEPKYLLRLLQHQAGDPTAHGDNGVLRAFLSNSYKTIDSYDAVLAMLNGLREGGEGPDTVDIDGDLTERRMILRVRSKRVAALAPKLLENYRSPFGGHDVGAGWTPERVANASRHEGQAFTPGGEPIVFAGFVFSNSEVGQGAFDLRPRLVVRVCKNGMTINAEAISKTHLGARLDEGAVKWSAETERANLELITRQTADAVRTWLSPEFLADAVDNIERAAGAVIEDAPAVIEAVSKKLRFSDEQAKSILDMFIRGGDMTAGGVMQAVTASAQVQDDGEAARDMEMAALDAMAYATAAAK